VFYEIKTLLRRTRLSLKFSVLLFLRCPTEFAFTFTYAEFLRCAFEAVALRSVSSLRLACLFFGVATFCVFLYNGTIWSIYAPFCVRIEGRLRSALFRKIASFPCERIEASSQGEWLTRLNTDVEMPFSQPLHLPHAACAVVNIAVSAAVLWRADAIIFGWAALFVIAHVTFNQLLIARAMPGMNRKALEAAGKNADDLVSLLTCADTAALYDGAKYLTERFRRSSDALLCAKMRMHLRKAIGEAVLPLFGLGGYLALLAVCAGRVASGAITFGGLTAAFQYRSGLLAGSFMLINSMINIQASMAGIRRINEVMA
jgi:ABC-type bacteriocin/lantibiotic exporter with double-glycine peptidase domain